VKLYTSRIVTVIKDYVIAEEDILLEKAILDFMQKYGLTLSTAESCTGGYVAHLITQIAGSSAVYFGGAVSYSNELKIKMLNVSASLLNEFGAVSEETVREMASGAIANFNTDYSIAITGIAGPDGGTPEKPVGTVWIAVASKTNIRSRKFLFGSKRAQNIERSAVNALTMLLNLLKEDHR
jgi:nicotinamide-nucleotide amidase